MAAEPPSHRVSVEEYLALEKASDVKHEYVDGHMILMAGGSRNHSRIAVRMLAALDRWLGDGPCRVFNSDIRVRIGDRYFYPDIRVSCDERDAGEGEDLRHPSVIFEVPSRHTEAYDRGDKFDMYQECQSLREYVLINMRRPEVQVYRRAQDAWMLMTFRAGDDIMLSSLELSIPVAEIYEGIELHAETMLPLVGDTPPEASPDDLPTT